METRTLAHANERMGRFQITRLEERIAPDGGLINVIVKNNDVDVCAPISVDLFNKNPDQYTKC